jgi:hypothetical protein
VPFPIRPRISIHGFGRIEKNEISVMLTEFDQLLSDLKTETIHSEMRQARD